MQDRLSEVRKALRRAEDRLADLMRDAVEARAYDEVAEIAAVSRRLHALAGGAASHSDMPEEEERVAAGATKPRRSRRQDSARGHPKGTYPRFTREGDRLVKIGWSKKDRTEYRHKAPKRAVEALVTALASVGPAEFSVDTLFPVTDDEGAEVPSYQAYLALAWLRSWGAVRRESRGGYRVEAERLQDSELAARWQGLPDSAMGGDR